MRINTLLIVGLLVSGFVVGCKKGDDKDCSFIAPQTIFNHFTASESDTLIVRRYTQGADFGKPLDSMVISDVNLDTKVLGKDTILVSTSYKVFNEEFYKYDWELVLRLTPFKSRVVRIKDVEVRFDQSGGPVSACHSYVSSVNVDGKIYQYNSWFVDSYKFYIEP